MPRYFTVEEARASLPHIRGLLEEAQQRKARVEELGGDMARSAAATLGNGHAPTNGSQPRRLELERAVSQIEEIVRQVEATGCLVKDIDAGLVDWPHLRDGREVCLCWHLGERDIAFWHEISAGFRGRQPL
jgi:hypothetical protein